MIGFIGLGIHGRKKAISLIRAGHKLVVYDKMAKMDELLSMGAESAVSNKDVALRSNIIITMLPNLLQLREAILGTGGVIEGLKDGSIVIEMSSVSPDQSGSSEPAGSPANDLPDSPARELARELADAVKAKNAVFLDGSPGNGGDRVVLEKLEPILSVLGIPAL